MMRRVFLYAHRPTLMVLLLGAMLLAAGFTPLDVSGASSSGRANELSMDAVDLGESDGGASRDDGDPPSDGDPDDPYHQKDKFELVALEIVWVQFLMGL